MTAARQRQHCGERQPSRPEQKNRIHQLVPVHSDEHSDTGKQQNQVQHGHRDTQPRRPFTANNRC